MQIISWQSENFVEKQVIINVLAQNESAKEIQILLAKDSVMKEHIAPNDISVQVLKGKIWFEVSGEKCELNALDMISLKAKVPHSLGGLEDSIVRLSLAKNDSIQRVSAVLRT